MKNRIWKRTKGITMTALLLMAEALGGLGQVPKVQAAEAATIVMRQEASWTDSENGRGEIYMEVSGLLGLRPVEDAGSTEENPNLEAVPEELEWGFTEDAGAVDSTVTGEDSPITEECAGFMDDTGEVWDLDGTEISKEEVWVESDGEETQILEQAESLDTAEEPDNADSAETADNVESAGGFDEAVADGELVEFIEMPQTEMAQTEENAAYEPIDSPYGEDAFAEEAAVYAAAPNPIYIVNYLSEYFEPDAVSLPPGCSTEPVTITNQMGQQTIITKIVCPIYPETITEDTWALSLPVLLREEYRVSPISVAYPVSQDEPLQKDRAGTGAFVMQETLQGPMILAQAQSPTLGIEAAEADFALVLKPDTDTVKAGARTGYEMSLTNTGKLPLTDIQIQSIFSKAGLTQEWEEAKNLQVQGNQVVLKSLEPGETRTLYLSVQLSEEEEGSLEHTISASTLHPGNAARSIVRKDSAKVQIQTLGVDFTVEKTADRTTAMPGDTITYQICIRNTGERTLHSVVSTERFLSAGVNAQFVEQPGVTLSSTKTQAMIPQIAPGETFALQAKVTLPYYMTDQDLINQVSVVTRETGNRTVQSQAGVTLQNSTFAPTPTPYISNPVYYGGGGSTKSSGGSWGVTSHPKTGDETPTGLFAALLMCSLLFGMLILKLLFTRKLDTRCQAMRQYVEWPKKSAPRRRRL